MSKSSQTLAPRAADSKSTSTSVPHRRRTQVERSEETKHRLLRAAVSVISRNGYSELRVGDVAKEAGVSVGAQLHHFPTKDALVLAVIEYSFAETTRPESHPLSSNASINTVLDSMIEGARTFYISEHFLVGLNILLSAAPESILRLEVVRVAQGARVRVESYWRERLADAGCTESLAAEIVELSINHVRGFVIRGLWKKDLRWWVHCLQVWRRMLDLLLASEGLNQPKRRIARTPKSQTGETNVD